MKVPVVIRKSGLVEYPYVAELQLKSSGLIDHGNLELFPTHIVSSNLYLKRKSGRLSAGQFFIYEAGFKLPPLSVLESEPHSPDDYVRIDGKYIEINVFHDDGDFDNHGKYVRRWVPTIYCGRFKFVLLE